MAAVAIAGLLAYMPAYYVSWARYTQMTGLLVLAPLCLLTAELMQAERRRPWLLALTALLLAGLALVHYRVLAFYVTFWLCYAVWALWRPQWPAGGCWGAGRYRRNPGAGGAGRHGALGVALCAGRGAHGDRRARGLGGHDSYNTSFSTDLLKVGWTPALLIWAGLGAVWAAVRRAWRLAWVVPWVGLWLLLANLAVLGLPNTWFLNSAAVIISFWVPVGILGAGWPLRPGRGCWPWGGDCGRSTDGAWRWLSSWRRPWPCLSWAPGGWWISSTPPLS